MNSTEFYCKTFDLKKTTYAIYDKKDQAVGYISDDIVTFVNSKKTIKESDLFLLAFEEIDVHS